MYLDHMIFKKSLILWEISWTNCEHIYKTNAKAVVCYVRVKLAYLSLIIYKNGQGEDGRKIVC